MRAYLWTTGVIFALLAVVHVWRIVAESAALAREPIFLLLTAAALFLCLWAGVLLRRTRPNA